MKTKLLAVLLMAGGALFAETHVSIGVQIGAPVQYRPVPVAPVPVVAGAYRPPCPGPGYVWIDGYYDAYGNWFDGYWTMPPYAGAYWIAPRISGGHFYAGYWGGNRGAYRNGYRFESHERERRDFGWREPERREQRGGWDRDREHGRGRGGDFERGFRR